MPASDAMTTPTTRVRGTNGAAVTPRASSPKPGSEREEDVKDFISTVPGFTSYEAFRNNGGGQTVTVCQDKTGTDESSRRAAAWVKENVGVTVDPPRVTEGGTVLHF
jgi:hypothetical protein